MPPTVAILIPFVLFALCWFIVGYCARSAVHRCPTTRVVEREQKNNSSNHLASNHEQKNRILPTRAWFPCFMGRVRLLKYKHTFAVIRTPETISDALEAARDVVLQHHGTSNQVFTGIRLYAEFGSTSEICEVTEINWVLAIGCGSVLYIHLDLPE